MYILFYLNTTEHSYHCRLCKKKKYLKKMITKYEKIICLKVCLMKFFSSINLKL